MDRCPTCRRRFAPADRHCARCGTDLGPLRAWRQAAENAAARAACELTAGRARAARAEAAQAVAIDPGDPRNQRIAALAALAERDFPAAFSHYLACRKE